MTLKLKENAELTVPPSIRRKAGIKPGDRLRFSAKRGQVTISAEAPVDEREDTPEQRKAILAGLAEAEKGPFYGPFEIDEAIRFIKAELKRRKALPEP